MNQRKYLREVAKKLLCKGTKKKEIVNQVEADIKAALEAGEAWEEIQRRLGKPVAIAARFNADFTEEEKAKAKKAKRTKTVVKTLVILAVIFAVIYWWLPKTKDIEKSESFNRTEVTALAENVISLYLTEDYEALQSLATPAMAEYLTEEELDTSRKFVSSNWGEFVAFGDISVSEVLQKGDTYAFVQIGASYENVSVTFSLIFDTDGKLTGFYMK